MKKIIAIILLTLPLLMGTRILWMRSGTLAWDPAAGEGLSYEVLAARPDGKATPILLGETTVPEFAFDLKNQEEGDWLLGVRTTRFVVDQKLSSSISWSDDPTVTIDPFILRSYKDPDAVKNIRLK